jgi:hypothetical protein
VSNHRKTLDHGELDLQLGWKFGGETHVMGCRLAEITVDNIEESLRQAVNEILVEFHRCNGLHEKGHVIHRGGYVEYRGTLDD